MILVCELSEANATPGAFCTARALLGNLTWAKGWRILDFGPITVESKSLRHRELSNR